MSNTTQHTPEPWCYSTSEDADGYYLVTDIGSSILGKFFKKEDAERVSNCINACIGMPNPSIYIQAMHDEASALKKSFELADAKAKNYIKQDKEIRSLINADSNESTYDEVERLKNQRDTLQQQRDELIEALRTCYASLATYGNHPIIRKQVDAAIAKAKGGTNG